MRHQRKEHITNYGGHRAILVVVLCLFGLCLAQSRMAPKKKAPRKKVDERVYLVHADQLTYDMYGRVPGAQILNGHVQFKHKGATMSCDSAYFFEATNSFEAFGHVRMRQGDTLSLNSDYAYYDGNEQMARARRNVLLTHRKTKLYTDSLDFDRLYNLGYFFEGGKMVDNDNVLTSDWGQYNTEEKMAEFRYSVNLKNPKFLLQTDTLYYDTHTSLSHVVGPSTITSDASVIHTEEGYYDTKKGKAQLYGRSTLTNKNREMTGDSLFYDEKTGVSEGFNNVVYKDKQNDNELHSDYFWYNEQTGEAYATKRALLLEYSQGDTLYLHSDSMKMYSYYLNTDSVYRKMHLYNKVRAYRKDMQAVCDSLVYNTKDSCMTMYKDPIIWYEGRQLLGEVVYVYMNDSTINYAHVNGQALSVEKADEEEHYNQLSSRDMYAYFRDGNLYLNEAVGNVLAIYYPVDEQDSTLILLNYTETDTLRMYMKNKVLDRVWTSKSEGTMYPMTQIPPDKYKLSSFAWFDDVRPVSKEDIFVWRGKKQGMELKNIERHAVPLQKLPVTEESEE